MKTILSIIPYLYTEKDLNDLYEELKKYPRHHFFNRLPEWCVREDNGCVDYTEYYHQFTGTILTNPTQAYILFNITPVDEILKEEISQAGFDGLFEGFDWRSLFSHIVPNDPPFRAPRIPKNTHIVVDIIYEGTGEDMDMYIEVQGFLDGRMDLLRI